MDNFAAKIEQILNDPGQLQQIVSMASSLGLDSALSKTIVPEQDIAEKINHYLNQAKIREEKQQALIHALLPYLKPGRQARLERAMQFAHLSGIAGAALQTSNSPAQNKEIAHV